MSRSGPPGRTAQERSTHLTRAQDQNPAEHGTGAPVDRLLPDDEAEIERQWQEAKAAGTPVSRRYLRERLRREFARAEDHWDGGAVLTYIRHGGGVSRSVPVDPMAEQIASRLPRRVA